MTFHKEGYPTLIVTLIFSAIIIFIARYFFPAFPLAHWFAYLLSGFLLITVIQFFRSPKRQYTIDAAKVIAPADGKVVVIEETEEGEYFKDKRLQVSIFMSPVNVHSNRYPIAGLVKFVKYHPGKFLAAWEPKSSTENERTTVVVEHSNGKQVLFRQIAGALARRIVIYAKEGDKAVQGEEFGFIKFGSRVDVFLPVGTKINVKIGDKVKGTQSIIAEI
jgi:phosphatidylserine decarboxylase